MDYLFYLLLLLLTEIWQLKLRLFFFFNKPFFVIVGYINFALNQVLIGG